MTEAKEAPKGVKEFKELCVFLALSATCAQNVMADGSLSMGDVTFAVSPLMALPNALAGIGEVPSEVMDLDPAEAEEIKNAIAEKLDLKNDAAEIVAEQIIGAALQFAAAALSIKNAKKV